MYHSRVIAPRTTARTRNNAARRNCTGTAFFRHPAGNKIRRAAFVSMINF